jgi:hypothetical protein
MMGKKGEGKQRKQKQTQGWKGDQRGLKGECWVKSSGHGAEVGG